MKLNRIRIVAVALSLAMTSACSDEYQSGSQLRNDQAPAVGSGDQLGWVRYQNLPIEGCNRRVLAGAARLPNVVYVTPLAMVGLDSRFAQDIHLRAPSQDQAGSLNFTVYFPDLDLGDRVEKGEITPPEHVRELLQPGCSPERIKASVNKLRRESPAVGRLLPEPITHVEPLPVSAVGISLSGGLKTDPVFFGTPGTTGDLTYSGRSFPAVIPVPNMSRYRDLVDMLTKGSSGLPVEVSFHFSARINGEWISVNVKREELRQRVQSLVGLNSDNSANSGFNVDGVTISASTQFVTESQLQTLFKRALTDIGVNVRSENGTVREQRYEKLVERIITKLIEEDQDIVLGPDDQDTNSPINPNRPRQPNRPFDPIYSPARDSLNPRSGGWSANEDPHSHYQDEQPDAPQGGQGSGVTARSELKFKFHLVLQRLSAGADFGMTIDNTESARGASVSVPTVLRARRSESHRYQKAFQSSLDPHGQLPPWETVLTDLRNPTTLRIWPQRVERDSLQLDTDRHFLSREQIRADLSKFTSIFPFLSNYHGSLADWGYNGQTLGWIWESWFRVPGIGNRRFRVWGYDQTVSRWQSESVQEAEVSRECFRDVPVVVGFGGGGGSVRLAELLEDDPAGRWTGAYDSVAGALVVTFDPAKVGMVQMRNVESFETIRYASKSYFEQVWRSGQPLEDAWFVESRHDEYVTEKSQRSIWQLNFVTVEGSVIVEPVAQISRPQK